MVISNWTDTSISLVVGLPVDVQDLYQQNFERNAFLSPLIDVSPLTFPAATPATLPCPISAHDNLYFTVTNPQSGVPASLPQVQVIAAGTQKPF